MSQLIYGASPAVESIDDFFERSGPIPTKFDEARRFPRFFFRSCAEAVVYPLGKGAAQPGQRYVLTCDLSRTGLRLLHNEQLFPGQRLDIILNGQPPRQTEVVWCKRLDKGRYAVGCRFASEQA
jgi:hypothetical protein